MKRRLSKLEGFSIGASDGEIGKVKDFYFDDETWTIRYLVVETGSWLFGRKVLIATEAITGVNWDEKNFPVNLTKDQIKHSPEIDTEKPVSRQQEIKLYQYYPWTHYWGGGLWAGGIGTVGMATPGPGTAMPLDEAVQNNETAKDEQANPHLRSTDEVSGYVIKATDGHIGDVEDFVVDEFSWKIDLLVIDTGNWLPGKKVLISPRWIHNIDWGTSSVVVDVTKDKVKNSPEFDDDEHLTEQYQADLHSHYGKSI